MEYYIVNLSHQRRDQDYIVVWRPECKGYAWPLSWAGKYEEDEVRSALHYYNSGENVAVPCHVLDALALPKPKPRQIDGDAGPVVPNTKETWAQILANVIAPPKYQPWPEYRGAPRKKRSNAELKGDCRRSRQAYALSAVLGA